MVLDSSALAAILFDEPEAPEFEAAIELDTHRLLSAVNFLEIAMIVENRLGEHGGRELDLWLHKAGVQIVAFDDRQAELARHAWRVFGKGSHPAGLNLGDCCAYALSKTSGEALLFKGDDFSKTDIVAAPRIHE